MDYFKLGKILTILLMTMAFGFWILSMERCGVFTICEAQTANAFAQMLGLSSIIIAIFTVHYGRENTE